MMMELAPSSDHLTLWYTKEGDLDYKNKEPSVSIKETSDINWLIRKIDGKLKEQETEEAKDDENKSKVKSFLNEHLIVRNIIIGVITTVIVAIVLWVMSLAFNIFVTMDALKDMVLKGEIGGMYEENKKGFFYFFKT